MEITDWVLIWLSLSISFGTEVRGRRQNVFETVSVFVYLRRVFAQTCPSTDSTRWHTRPRVLTLYLNLSLQLIFISTLEITRDTKSITWVRCASGNALFQYASDKISFKSLVRWRHSCWSQIWPMNSFICIFSNFGHQVPVVALVVNLVTRWRYMHRL